jgi:hypothetical protein
MREEEGEEGEGGESERVGLFKIRISRPSKYRILLLNRSSGGGEGEEKGHT